MPQYSDVQVSYQRPGQPAYVTGNPANTVAVTIAAPEQVSVTQYVVGPKGEKGDPGSPGGAANLREYDVAAIGGAQTLTLPDAAVAKVFGLFINGLFQLAGSYSVAGNSVQVPAQMGAVAGDTFTVIYFV